MFSDSGEVRPIVMDKTLFVYYAHKPGGLCPRLYRAIRACSDRGDCVRYLSLDAPPDGVIGEGVFHRIPFPLTARRGLLFWGGFTVWLPLYLLFVSVTWRPNRIVAFGAYYSAVSILAKGVCGVPVVLFLRSLTFKNDELTGKPSWLRKITGAVDAIGISRASLVVSMTQEMRREAERFSGRELSNHPILSNDLPIRREEQIARARSEQLPISAPFSCVVMGVIDQRKNIGVLIETWRILGLTTDFQLEILGDGPLKKSLESSYQGPHHGTVAPSAKTNVVFRGWVENTQHYLQSAAVMLHPALHEGVSNAVLEALATGVPVLASDIPEHRELFGLPEGGGNLIAPHDARAWAEAVQRFLSDEGYRSAVAEIGRATAERLTFDWAQAAFDVTRF